MIILTVLLKKLLIKYQYKYIDIDDYICKYKYTEKKGENMAFDNNQEKISNLLKATEASTTQSHNSNFEFERTKKYMFSLQPSVREKLTQIANERGYRSASSFLNDYFKNFEL